MGFIAFLKDENAMKGFTQFCLLIFGGLFLLGSIVYIIWKDVKPDQVLPLVTFIIGTMLGGVGAYAWRAKHK